MALRRKSVTKKNEPDPISQNNDMIIIKNLQSRQVSLAPALNNVHNDFMLSKAIDAPKGLNIYAQNLSNVITEPLILSAEASREIEIMTNIIESSSAIETLTRDQIDSK